MAKKWICYGLIWIPATAIEDMDDLPDNEVSAFLEAIVSYQKDDSYRPSLQYSPEFRIAFRHAMDDIDEYDARYEIEVTD